MSLLFPWVCRSVLLVSTALVLALVGCSSTTPPSGITAVTPFDLARYEGRWYEVARLDHSFERGMTDVSATYQRPSDGSVRTDRRFNRMRPSIAPRKRHQAG